MTKLADSYHRPINYLRISVTDRCNLRCIYCMPPEGIPLMSHGDVLRYEEIDLVARAAAELGITKLRLTGGEPLVRTGLTDLVAMLAKIKGIDDISMTTNGVLLDRYAVGLKKAGLHRVNISLDSLRPERFHKITRMGKLDDVLNGIEAAREAGLNPVKINMVVIRGTNDDEISHFALLTLSDAWHVRFIEFMPFMGNGKKNRFLVPVSEIMERIEALGKLEPSLLNGVGPARYYRFPGAKGTIGFISPVTECFCQACNRMRLTADGKLRPCLFSDDEIDLRGPLRQGMGVEEIKRLIRRAVAAKPERHKLMTGVTCERFMSQIGG
jgi:cyclic pyranopterin phosphate synthase